MRSNSDELGALYEMIALERVVKRGCRRLTVQSIFAPYLELVEFLSDDHAFCLSLIRQKKSDELYLGQAIELTISHFSSDTLTHNGKVST